MIFINYKIDAPREDVLSYLRDSNAVCEQEKFDTSRGTPRVHVDLRDEKLKLVCEMLDAPTKDRDFKMGTVFRGRIFQRGETTFIKGAIFTAPIYHAFLIILFAYFIYRCILLKGISLVPICILIFDVFMFWGEFKKQSIIKRYIFRALKMTYQSTHRRRSADLD